jgi:glycosyltransferase involved in cell wall biosynthesis
VTGKKFSQTFGPDLRDRILNAAGRSFQHREPASRPQPIVEHVNEAKPIGQPPAPQRWRAFEALSASFHSAAGIKPQQVWASFMEKVEGWFRSRRLRVRPASLPANDQSAASQVETVRAKPLWIGEHFEWHKDVDQAVLDQDVVLANALGDGWKPILKHYDVVQCYSVDGIIPMSHDRYDYLSYEHGTLRSIPFEPTPIGRLTATAYRLGSRSFVTNLDNLESCRRLKLARERVVPLPHALDDEKIHGFARKHAHIRPSGHDAPEFLSPARQHWLDKDPNLAKGNDIFFDALARLKAQGYRARVTLVAWGRDLEASKTYVRDIGIDDFVTWVPPMTGEELWKRYLACHAVVDQFIIPAFGRVTFDSLLLGKPVITNLDVDLATEFFTVAPPILVSATVDDAERALKRILDDPEDRQGIGAASGAWAATYHSTQRILDLQVDAYRQTIAERIANGAQRTALRAAG